MIFRALEKLAAQFFYRHAYDKAGQILLVGDRIQLHQAHTCWSEDVELKFAIIKKIDNRTRYPLTIQLDGENHTQISEAHNVKKITCEDDIYEPSGPADEEECTKFFQEIIKAEGLEDWSMDWGGTRWHCEGLCIEESKKISIWAGNSTDQVKALILHEIAHIETCEALVDKHCDEFYTKLFELWDKYGDGLPFINTDLEILKQNPDYWLLDPNYGK